MLLAIDKSRKNSMSIWSQASKLAKNTPEKRNRYVDFLRAASILFVISGHWLIATAYFDVNTGTLTPVMMLDEAPWTNWLTWVFQVMPIFFIVGGYANAVSLESARKKNTNYTNWLVSRLHRLLSPMLLLVVFWALLSLLLYFLGFSQDTIAFVSQAALVPTWFLAIYAMIVILAPVTYTFWQRLGYLSLFIYVALAVLVDVAFFVFDWKLLGWANYFWVWLAAHHLGFAWRDGRLGSPLTLIGVSVAALLLLAWLILAGPYPLAMAGSPENDLISNTLPPKITLLALGVFQFGLLMAIEKPMRRILNSHRLWTCTVLINGMIMTIYLWHMTILVGLLSLSNFADGIGITVEPGSQIWWLSRPVWLLVLTMLLMPVALMLSPLERIARNKDALVPSRWRQIGGTALVGIGLVFATLLGFDGNPTNWTNIAAIAFVLGGAAVCGLSPRLR